MTNEHLLTAFLLTLLAGLGTVVGSCIAFLAKRTDHRFLSVTTGFFAGTLIIGVIGTVAVAVFFRTPKRAIASESVLP
jgi:zinc transporter ZupT